MPSSDGTLGFFGSLGGHLKRAAPKHVLNSFQRFRRCMEREHQAVTIFDNRGAQALVFSEVLGNPGVLRSAGSSAKQKGQLREDTDDSSLLDLLPGSRCSTATPDLWRPSRCSTATPGAFPSSCSSATPDIWSETPDPWADPSVCNNRPMSRQSNRFEQTQKEIELAKEELGASKLSDIVRAEQMKRDYWESYSKAENAKMVLSDFEEYMRGIHEEIAKDQEIVASDMKNDDQSSLSNCPDGFPKRTPREECVCASTGFTSRTPREELVSAYARQCRESYALPLGPRQRVGVQKSAAAQLATPEMLLYEGWSLGSDRLNMLWNANSQGLRTCRHINLSGNRLEDRSVPLICRELLPTLEMLDLSKNLLTHRSAKYLADAINARRVKSPLMELNLEENMLGEVHEDDVCKLVEALEALCPGLRGLCLASNNLGKVDDSLGGTLGKMCRNLLRLKVLDLHWNSFGGFGAYQLLMGIYDSGQHDGRLSRLDLSWNRLNFVDPKHPHAIPAKVLADVLEDHRRLFHLDISYNSLGVEACQYIADGIRNNHSLLGFHIAGNAAALDAHGFVVAHETPGSIDPQLVNTQILSVMDPETHGRRNMVRRKLTPGHSCSPGGKSRLSRKTCTTFTNAGNNSVMSATDQHVVRLVKPNIGQHPLECLSIRAECCWICDRWRPIPITWTPGVSGPLQATEIESVHAYLSIDSFRRSMPLERKSKSNHVTWQAHFMLPMATAAAPALVVFEVNGCLERARDLPIRNLASEVCIGGKTLGSSMPGQVSREGSEDANAADLWIKLANEIPFTDEDQCLPQNVHRQPLVVTEDVVDRGKLVVAPRRVSAVAASTKPKWTRMVSIWSSYTEEDENLFVQMLEFDLALSKKSRFMPEVSQSQERRIEQQLVKRILPHFGSLMTYYRHLAIQGSGHAVFGITQSALLNLGNKCDIFDDHLQSKTLVNHSIAACVVDKKQADALRVRADNVIVRFQLLETILRSANTKYVATGRAQDLGEGVGLLLAELDTVLSESRKDLECFRKAYFIEEVDLVFKTYADVLHAIYDHYVFLHQRPGSNGMMSLPCWYDFLNDCEAFDEKFARRKAGDAFAYALLWHIDEVSSERHMHMNFVEFLVAIGAMIFMRRFWCQEEFADLVEEFFEDTVVPLLEATGKQAQDDTCSQKDPQGVPTGRPMHISKNELRATFEAIFSIADEDDNGTLSLREFRKTFRNPKVMAVLGEQSSKVEDLADFFHSLDEDGNEELTLDEAMAGFEAVRRLHVTADRAHAFLSNLCQGLAICPTSALPVQEHGYVSCSAVEAVLHRPAPQRKLMRLSLNPADVFAFLQGMDDGSLLDATSLVDDIMQLRTGKDIPKWKIVVKQMFEEADKGGDGTVSRKEWQKCLESPLVVAKFGRCGITKGIIDNGFSALDVDGDGDLTEMELVAGFERMLQEDRLQVASRRKSRHGARGSDVQERHAGVRRGTTQRAEGLKRKSSSNSSPKRQVSSDKELNRKGSAKKALDKKRSDMEQPQAERANEHGKAEHPDTQSRSAEGEESKEGLASNEGPTSRKSEARSSAGGVRRPSDKERRPSSKGRALSKEAQSSSKDRRSSTKESKSRSGRASTQKN